MRTAPALQLTVTRYGAWRTGLALVSLAALVVSCAWAATAAVPLLAAAGLLLVCALLVATVHRAERRRGACRLHWDGQQWAWSADGAGADAELQSGRLEVAVDLGRWMLLRLDAVSGAAPVRRRSFWLPVQANGLERQWHALRCAVYSPTPAADPLAALTPPTHER